MTSSPPISAADREKAPLPRILLSEDRKRLKKVAENAFRDGDEAGKPERKRFAGVKATELLALVNDAEVAATARARVVELEAALASANALRDAHFAEIKRAQGIIDKLAAEREAWLTAPKSKVSAEAIQLILVEDARIVDGRIDNAPYLAVKIAEAAEARATALIEAAKPFVRHYDASWMDKWADDAQSSTFSRHTFGELRALVAAINAGASNDRK